MNEKLNKTRFSLKQYVKENPLLSIGFVLLFLLILSPGIQYVWRWIIIPDEGIDIPDTFETVKAEDFIFGYPEDWTYTSVDGVHTLLAPNHGTGADELGDVGVIITNVTNDLSSEEINAIDDHNCDDFEKQFSEVGNTVTIEEVFIHRNRGCKVTFLEPKDNPVGMQYMYFVQLNENVYTLSVMNFAGGQEYVNEALPIIRTFQGR